MTPGFTAGMATFLWPETGCRIISTELVMLSTILSSATPFSSLPSVLPSIRVFSSDRPFILGGQSIGASASVLSMKFRVDFLQDWLPFNEYSVLISFRIDWFDILAVQGTLKSLLQHRNSKASILQCSAFKSSRLPGEISITLDMQMIPHLRQKVKKN